ncbi:hypothetical protein LAZ67_3005568 [Cordylochernes scorpioides]|uniref:Uncharacterized protein n=1 Tax=Cordylochernes scorpioides TaxID=51811 RepID=A0ABY6KAK1_9ARAC|nr:hypothetical protein LAZ67_3005568 [Cordylochernes scorpioides]
MVKENIFIDQIHNLGSPVLRLPYIPRGGLSFKAIPKYGDCFKYTCKTLPGLYEVKLKEGIFVGPSILKNMKNTEFETRISPKEK